MSLSIADIDRWSPEAITAVGAAATARAKVASQAGSRLKNLPVFDSWQGEGAKAAQARTHALAAGLERHGQAASAVAMRGGIDGAGSLASALRRVMMGDEEWNA